MRLTNHVPLLVLICIIAFGIGSLNLIGAIGILGGMEHSWRKVDLYCYLFSAPVLVLPLVIVGFNRRLAWSLLVVGVSLFTIGVPVMSLTTGTDLASWHAAILMFVLGVAVLLILLNRKVVEETVKPESQHSPAN